MLVPGLVSVTFRHLSPSEIIDLAVRHRLPGIEWGGDVHVPPGDLDRAREVRQATEAAGLKIAAYGSYYRVGDSSNKAQPFEPVLASARALGAPLIRVWPGTRGSAEADADYHRQVEEDALRIANLASAEGVGIAYEFHGGTLTDTNESARDLLGHTEHPAISTLWQPPNGQSFDYCLEGLRAVLPRVSNVHAFHWWPSARERHPLAAGADRWQGYLEPLRTTGRDHFVLLEFVVDDDPANLADDAATLREWLEG
jgi:3-dehydroshikimate dehydratase